MVKRDDSSNGLPGLHIFLCEKKSRNSRRIGLKINSVEHLNEKEKPDMPFVIEPDGYTKTILSDLQGAWSELREEVVEASPFEHRDRALFHIDEAMSFETVRSLDRMRPLLLIIRNLCTQGGASESVMEALDEVAEVLEETLEEFPR